MGKSLVSCFFETQCIYIFFRDTFVRYQLIGLYVVVVQSSLQTIWRRAMDAADAADDDDDEDNDGDAQRQRCTSRLSDQ